MVVWNLTARGTHITDGNPSFADAHFGFVKDVMHELRAGDFLVPKTFGGYISGVNVLLAGGAEFLELAKAEAHHGRSGGGAWILFFETFYRCDSANGRIKMRPCVGDSLSHNSMA
jgi:hypothetical protein